MISHDLQYTLAVLINILLLNGIAAVTADEVSVRECENPPLDADGAVPAIGMWTWWLGVDCEGLGGHGYGICLSELYKKSRASVVIGNREHPLCGWRIALLCPPDPNPTI